MKGTVPFYQKEPVRLAGRCTEVGELVEEMLTLVAPPGCAACTASVPRVVDVFCRACASLVETHEHPSAAYEYGGPVADAIRRFKYEGQSHLALPLGAALARGARRWAGRVDMVVPVPLHWRRRWGRGYDQAGLLAKPVARALGVPLRLRTLRRTRNTPKQASLRGSERRSNMLGAFASRALPPNARVLLVDDVRTTGATLEAATAALREAGAAEVCSIVLAVRVLRATA